MPLRPLERHVRNKSGSQPSHPPCHRILRANLDLIFAQLLLLPMNYGIKNKARGNAEEHRHRESTPNSCEHLGLRVIDPKLLATEQE